MAKINFNAQGQYLEENLYVHAKNTDLSLSHDLFITNDFSIEVNGETLVVNSDYVLTNIDERLRTEKGLIAYKNIQFIKDEYVGITVEVHYRAIGDFIKCNDFMQGSSNLSELTNTQVAMNNIVNEFEDDEQDIEDNNTIIVQDENTWYKATLLKIWNYIKTKIENGLGLSDIQYNGKLSKKLTLIKGETTLEFDGSNNVIAEIPTVNNKTLTIKQNGSTLGTYDGSEAKTVDITNPTRSAGRLNTYSSASFTLPARSVFFGSVVRNGGASFSSNNYSELYFNYIAWSSGTKSLSSEGTTVSIANLSSNAKTITLSGNGGGEVGYILI